MRDVCMCDWIELRFFDDSKLFEKEIFLLDSIMREHAQFEIICWSFEIIFLRLKAVQIDFVAGAIAKLPCNFNFTQSAFSTVDFINLPRQPSRYSYTRSIFFFRKLHNKYHFHNKRYEPKMQKPKPKQKHSKSIAISLTSVIKGYTCAWICNEKPCRKISQVCFYFHFGRGFCERVSEWVSVCVSISVLSCAAHEWTTTVLQRLNQRSFIRLLEDNCDRYVYIGIIRFCWHLIFIFSLLLDIGHFARSLAHSRFTFYLFRLYWSFGAVLFAVRINESNNRFNWDNRNADYFFLSHRKNVAAAAMVCIGMKQTKK